MKSNHIKNKESYMSMFNQTTIKYSRKTYKLSYSIGYLLTALLVILDMALLFSTFIFGVLFAILTYFIFKGFKLQKYIYDNYEELTSANTIRDDYEVIADKKTDEINIISGETKEINNIQSVSYGSIYIEKFKEINIYDITKILEDNFLKKIQITKEVEYEKYIKYVNTTQRPTDFVVFDLETTGLSCTKNEIIEIGAIRFREGNPVEEFHTYVKPKKKISEKITSINGITNEMVSTAPSIEEVLPYFIDFIKEDVLIAHNAPFDMGFILENTYKFNYKKIKNKVIDTLSLSRKKVREYDFERNRNLKLGSYKLEELNWRFGLNLPSHNAIDDCKVCAYVYLMIQKEYDDICYVEY